MGKEEDININVVASGQECLNGISAQESSKLDPVGLRTPLRALIARESGLLWTLEPTDSVLLKSPARKKVDAGRNGFVKAGSHSPQSGSSSPKTFGTRMVQVSHKIRVFKKAGAQPTPQPEERPVQLGSLFAQERATSLCEENCRMAIFNRERLLLASNGVKNVLPLRDLIAAEMASSCVPTADDSVASVGHAIAPATENIGNMVRESSGGAMEPVLAPEESQELRYLFARDWALQTSDEEDEFWDSGSLCGAVMPLRSRHDPPRRRTRSSKSEKSSASSHFATGQATESERGSPSRINSPSIQNTASVASRLCRVQDLYAQSPGRVCSRLSAEPRVGCGGSTQLTAKPSLGTLLAEESLTARSQSLVANVGLGGISPGWSAAVDAGENSRRLKIGSLSDISAPVHPESQSQLDYLVAKFSTTRTDPVHGQSATEKQGIQSLVRQEPAQMGTTLAGEDGGSTSGCLQATANLGQEDEVDETFSSATLSAYTARVTDVPFTRPVVDTPNILPNLQSHEVLEGPAPSTWQEAHSSLEEPTSSFEDPNMVSEAGAGESRHGDGADISQSNPSGEAVAAPQVQLGTLLERARDEHGWLPLGRSRMGSPLLIRSQSSSTSTLRFSVLPDTNCPSSLGDLPHGPSRAVIDSQSNGIDEPSPSAGMVLHLILQQSPNPETEAEAPPVEAVQEMDATPARERPPTRVSLLTLLNQDMEADESGLQAQEGGCKDDEQDDQVTEQLDPMCCVCMVGHKGAAFIPCGHTFCRRCCREVRRSIGTCPLCNQAIVDVLHIF